MIDNAATPRGCGMREKGGIYAVAKLGRKGRPLEDFLIDPPLQPTFDVPALGMKPITDSNGITHLLDWIGQAHYPNVWDFIEEVRRIGLSRRVPASAPFDLLTSQSRILTVHAGAFVYDRDQIGHTRWTCPTDTHQGGEVDAMCIGLPLWLMEKRALDQDFDMPLMPPGVRSFRRTAPAGYMYTAFTAPQGVEIVTGPAIFASWPIACFEVVRGGSDEEMDRAQRALKTVQLPVMEVDF